MIEIKEVFKTDTRDRVKLVREELGLSQSDFGAKLCLERSAISLIERKQRNITERTTKDICREFNVSYIWLTEGIGDMFENSDQEVTAMFDRIMAGENETAKAVFKAFAKLGDPEWLMLKNLIEEIADNLKK